VATTIGTVVAFLLVPMRSLGNDNWKIAAALMGRHIGGGQSPLHSLASYVKFGLQATNVLTSLEFGSTSSAVNYVAVSEALQVSPSVLAAGLAADNVICALYFTTLFALAAKIPAETMQSEGQSQPHVLLQFPPRL
jgi:uncharacterized membrane protein